MCYSSETIFFLLLFFRVANSLRRVFMSEVPTIGTVALCVCVCVLLLNIAKFWWGPLYSYISKQSSLSCCYDMESKTKRILCWIKLCSFTRTLGKAFSIKPTSASLNDWLALHCFISSHRLDPDRRQFVCTARWVYRPQSGYVWERV